MVYEIFVEKKKQFAAEAKALKEELKTLIGIDAKSLRILNKYDVENVDQSTFEYCVKTVFSEPQLDDVTSTLDLSDGEVAFGVEARGGQFDQRADSAAQCIQLISQGERPIVKNAKVYVFEGLSAQQIERVQRYVVNPVDSVVVPVKKYDTLKEEYEIPERVETLDGFITWDDATLAEFGKKSGFAMDFADLKFCQDYFKSERKNPTVTEIKVIDTYWSDHCRHTTFNTVIDSVHFEDKLLQDAYADYLAARDELNRTKPITLMDIGTIAAKLLKKRGILQGLDESEENNACTVKIKVDVDGDAEDWLLLFKNETHNHPTEIEPFGGAATCIGGAIRDPLSGRAYVYAAMRVTGAGNPLKSVADTIKGKLPQRKLVTTAANGYSSYGNQIGLATGIVDEIYHEGYTAKRMEIGAVVGAVPQANVVRIRPSAGDKIILLGGKTGRDGCGGATGSSKSLNVESIAKCGAEVQKGNAPEERKLQRLFRNKEASLLIKKCNDFGAGGVAVAIGELADGLEIDLNRVPKKYEGLDGTELAISESQERMAVVVAPENVDKYLAFAHAENIEATIVAEVKDEPRLKMKWNGAYIVDISREFLDSNGAEKHVGASSAKCLSYARKVEGGFVENMQKIVSDLNVCGKEGLSERFDSTIGAGTVLMPFGGKNQRTPIQAMVNKISIEKGNTDCSSVMAWGFNPYIAEKSPYHGAYLAVVESCSKLVATGAEFESVYLTFQEYFERLRDEAKRWGVPLAALLGAFEAQKDLGVGAIGGKDSMSGSFEDIDVPPTLVSFAVTTMNAGDVKTNCFKRANHVVALLCPQYDANSLPDAQSLKSNFAYVNKLMRDGSVVSAYTPTYGGVAEAVAKMCFGNGVGFAFDNNVNLDTIFGYLYGSFVLELADGVTSVEGALRLGKTTVERSISLKDEIVRLETLEEKYSDKLESIYPTKASSHFAQPTTYAYAAKSVAKCSVAKGGATRVLIPVFPGTNCEYDAQKAFASAGADVKIFVINNLTSKDIAESANAFAKEIEKSQILFIPGGFSGGDEPDGSGKFITAFLRGAQIKDAVHNLLDARDGLVGGICNGFQALIKLGLVPYGKIVDTTPLDPTLTFNTISRHQSEIVRVRVSSNNSPWLSACKVGDVYSVPISHGEGRFVADEATIKALGANGQIATQYVDLDGKVSMDIRFNPNGSVDAVEGILSPDGRVFGKMGHAERKGSNLYKNVDGNYDMKMFESAVRYFD